MSDAARARDAWISIGLFAAAAAPLLNVRKLRRMSIPDTIRYVE